MAKQCYQFVQIIGVIICLLALIACQPIQPVRMTEARITPTQPPLAEVVAPTATPLLDEESRLRATVALATQAIFTPTQPYSGTFVSTLMGMPVLWVDYTVTTFSAVHGYGHSGWCEFGIVIANIISVATIVVECQLLRCARTDNNLCLTAVYDM